jgi:hypothetical protein
MEKKDIYKNHKEFKDKFESFMAAEESTASMYSPK